jgi:hypothetical protein
MRTTILCLVGALAASPLLGCARETREVRAPRVDIPASTTQTPAREAKSEPVYDTQKGFENALPPPDAVGGGPVQGTESDVGEPKWRNNPGSYDDGKRPKATPRTHNQDMHLNDNHVLPPDHP